MMTPSCKSCWTGARPRAAAASLRPHDVALDDIQADPVPAPHPDVRTGASHRTHWSPADLQADKTPALPSEQQRSTCPLSARVVGAVDVEYGGSHRHRSFQSLSSTPNSKLAWLFADSNVSCQVSATQTPARFRRRRKNAPSASSISTATGSGSCAIVSPLGLGIPRRCLVVPVTVRTVARTRIMGSPEYVGTPSSLLHQRRSRRKIMWWRV